jgi:hypothetical protein
MTQPRRPRAGDKARIMPVEEEVVELRETVRRQEGELGRLKATAEQLPPLREERDTLVRRLADVEASTDRRIRDAVVAALDEAGGKHAAAIAALEKERDGLAEQIGTLRDQLEGKGVTGRVEPTVLAGQFAAVLDALATPEPQEGRPYAAALTSLEVEARGVLEAPAEGREQPMLRTVESGVDPGQLSSLRMSFKLLPHVTEAEPPPT